MIDKKYITQSREPFFEIAKRLIAEDSKVLDVGPGIGAFSEYCERSDFFLLEGNSETVEFLRRKYENVFFGNIPRIPFESNFFDLIHCSHIVEHLNPQELYEFLIEMDRTLKIGGNIVISTPMLWENFYNDLSHVKPYNPQIFEKYLCGVDSNNLTRPAVSSSYKLTKLVFRYRDNFERFNLTNLKPNNILNRFVNSIFWRLTKNGLVFLEKTGYTIVLRKNDL
ncbi:class I SAM-dependent methyltransferase [Algoriphagus sp. NG3]|uniref:class I SAM-dependent methyltransferase n=1 Tax=Algoriphagus sp. NG3 TaxID=3097546 RepID=UPI002A82142F|nr:class I SAM-dependent methyltransferase [Algoriphagus sp. NG3]WPR77407.1 class I SAM-dependent methyltransferase [Algoriphagus sp. NG3]